jgi:hypothetical protein
VFACSPWSTVRRSFLSGSWTCVSCWSHRLGSARERRAEAGELRHPPDGAIAGPALVSASPPLLPAVESSFQCGSHCGGRRGGERNGAMLRRESDVPGAAMQVREDGGPKVGPREPRGRREPVEQR